MQQELLSRIHDQPAFQALVAEIELGNKPVPLGLPRSVRLPVLAALRIALKRPILLITDRIDHALVLEDEWHFWVPDQNLELFPEPDPLYYEKIAWSRKTRRERLRVLAQLSLSLMPGSSSLEIPPLLVSPIRGVMTRTLPRREFLKSSRLIRVDQLYAPQAFAAEWIKIGYETAAIVTSPGQFARRGGILDIWPPGDRFPTRIEFFGDKIEMLRRFEPENQRTIEIIDSLLVTPAREFLLPETHLDTSARGQGEITEFHIPILHQEVSTLLNYIPQETLIFLDDEELLQETSLEISGQAESLRKVYEQEGVLPEGFPLPYLSWVDLVATLEQRNPISLGPVMSVLEPGLAGMFSPNQRFGGELKSFVSHIAGILGSGGDLVIVSRQAARLQEIWKERTNLLKKPAFLKGNIEGGWILKPELGNEVHVFSDGEIFGWRRIQPRRRPVHRALAPEFDYSDFNEGDWVVHLDHGIGRFAGLVYRQLGDTEGEYLAVEYADGDQLYVPAPQADRLTRYVGPDHTNPKITRLGSDRWGSIKSRVKEEVVKVAEDLLQLYARRETVQGYAFSPDSAWQQELEASFPYIETEDQLQVLSQVKRDMEIPKPMDRLICGDVGYGKTEIAVRAAFKAVMDGKQVAILVPTTVLAQQHYDTFLERMGGFPIEIRMLSRFRTPKQQQVILTGLVKGSVDIVIATHRLLSEDVVFHDLGLMIVDEEQRFGVSHKEKIKTIRTAIDVLTLTATPIPRTMYMALTGVRDISRINTPPEERLPVVTHVSPYDPELIQKAIWRELERGGQVFFVHNRVKTIKAMKSHLANLVPEARIGIAHGQMAEKDLAERMREFTAGKIDVLLSTSIIESGLDIPNANTLIVDRADMFGLAQLYQLRGRVGRGAQRAYAYFFKQRQNSPTLEGRQRLETILEHTALGAGYSIAMRDLEIRGSGDILGTRQHGYIAAVGFHLYTRLLADAVKRMNKQKPGSMGDQELPFQILRPLVQIDLPLPVGIPEDYIADRSVRLGLYRRAASILQREEIQQLKKEFTDRFGSIPETVENLLIQLEIKLLAEKAGLEGISVQSGQINLQYPEGKPLPQPWEFETRVRFGESSVWIPLDLKNRQWVKNLLNILEGLTSY